MHRSEPLEGKSITGRWLDFGGLLHQTPCIPWATCQHSRDFINYQKCWKLVGFKVFEDFQQKILHGVRIVETAVGFSYSCRIKVCLVTFHILQRWHQQKSPFLVLIVETWMKWFWTAIEGNCWKRVIGDAPILWSTFLTVGCLLFLQNQGSLSDDEPFWVIFWMTLMLMKTSSSFSTDILANMAHFGSFFGSSMVGGKLQL